MSKILFIVFIACLPFVFISGCGGDGVAPNSKPENGAINVTATTGMVGDIVRNVGGEHVSVTALMGPGVDPHLYKASQQDLSALSGADVIFYNGLHLEGRLSDVLVKMAHRIKTVAVSESIPEDLLREPPEFDGHFDPHIWFDASLWKFAVEHVRDVLVEMAPEHKSVFEANATAYLKELDSLHEYAKTRLSEIPEEQRVLVTAHDAFGYFGRAYNLDVMGLQGISTASEFGLKDVEQLVGILVERKVKAVFVESSVPTKSIEALMEGARANGHEVKMGGELFSDAMGEAGTPEGTYLGMFKHNVDTIAGALK